ncbi:MAG: S-layer homology domain-containing protein [Kineothrix sp.]
MKRKIVNLLLCACIALMPAAQGASAVNAAGGSGGAHAVSGESGETAAGRTIYVDGSSSATGSGTQQLPYKDFTTALSRAEDGDTIIIKAGGAFIGTETGNEMTPLVLDKAVTIEGESGSPSLSLRRAGILLEADVTLRNINLTLTNKTRAAICANGHRLELENVVSDSSARLVHVFAGNMYIANSSGNGTVPVGQRTGPKGEIIIKGSKTNLGNIYAGSMNGGFAVPAQITVEGAVNMRLGDIYASGALQGQYDEDAFLDYNSEPTAPAPSASAFPMTGRVSVRITGNSVGSVDGKMNEAGDRADVTFSTTNLESSLRLADIASLSVTGGKLRPAALNEGVNLSVAQGTALDLSAVMTANQSFFQVSDFTGGGTLEMNMDDTLAITGTVAGVTEFKTVGLTDGGSSGLVIEGHGYIDVSEAEGEGSFTFSPYPTQTSIVLEKVNDVWRAVGPGKEEENMIVLSSLSFSSPEVTARADQINALSGFKVDVDCAFADTVLWPDLGDIPFAYEIECLSQTYSGKSVRAEDGGYEAVIAPLNLKFLPWGSEENGSLWIYAADGEKKVYPAVYTIKMKAPEENGSLESTLKLTITGDGAESEVPQAPDVTAPVITAVTASAVTAETAVVTVTANDDWGIASYSLVKTGGEGEAAVTETETKGVFLLSGLTPSAEYTFTATVTDQAGNSSTETVSFRTAEAEKIDLSTATVTVDKTYVYTGSAIIPAAEDVTVTLNGRVVDPGGYSFTATNNVNAGTAVLSIRGRDGYAGSAAGIFTIHKAQGAQISSVAGSLALSQDLGTYTYRVTETAGAEYRMDDGPWQESSVFENIAPGSSHTFSARMKETANRLAGAPAGTGPVSFPVVDGGGDEEPDTTAPAITSVTASQVTAETALITVTAGDESGIAEYSLVKTDGEGEVTVEKAETEGVFRLSGLLPSAEYTFTAVVIDRAGNRSAREVSFRTAETAKIDLSSAAVTVNRAYVYTGSPILPAAEDVTVTLDGRVVEAGGYSFTAADNVNAGTAVLTIRGRDGYTGSAAGTFTIHKAQGAQPSAVTGSSALSRDGRAYTYRVTEIAGAEYRMDDGPWQEGPTFESIAPGSSHTFSARMKETANTLAGSPVSTGPVSFPVIGAGDKEPFPSVDITAIFSDVKEGDWFKEAVAYVYTNRIMTGMGSSDQFNPYGETTRAMVVKILHNAMGAPASSHKNPFADVPAGKWYEEPVRWALERGITTGISPAEFAPDRSVTRQEVASFLYRYAEYRGFDTSETKDLSGFPDRGEISAYAGKAMAWANAAGIITGKGGIYLDPRGTATRAEIAAMVQRFEVRYK